MLSQLAVYPEKLHDLIGTSEQLTQSAYTEPLPATRGVKLGKGRKNCLVNKVPISLMVRLNY